MKHRRFILTVALALVAGATSVAANPDSMPPAGAAPAGCKKFINVVFSVDVGFTTNDLVQYRNNCWGWSRPAKVSSSTFPGSASYPECRLNRDPVQSGFIWAYNEVHSTSSWASYDKSHIQKCRSYALKYAVNGYTLGHALFAYDVPRRHWEVSGHVPGTGVGKYYAVLELYGGVVGGYNKDAASPNAYSLWLNTYRGRGFYAMVNFAGTSSRADPVQTVLNVCNNTKDGGVVGLYGGQVGASLLANKSHLKKVAQALNTCTKR